MLGDIYFANGQLDKATTEYAALYNDHPQDLQVRKNYVQLLLPNDRLNDATKLNNEILKANPRDADVLVNLGLVQLRQGDAAGAVDSVLQALKSDPSNGMAHYRLGKAFEMPRYDAQAETEWREAVRLRPDLGDAQRDLATFELRRGDLDALAQTAQQMVNFVPTAPGGYLWRALAEMNRRKYSDAELDLNKAIEMAPRSAEPYVQMGNLRQLQKQYPEAIKFYQQALDKDSSSNRCVARNHECLHDSQTARSGYRRRAGTNRQVAQLEWILRRLGRGTLPEEGFERRRVRGTTRLTGRRTG
jgi:tetratricopeptide (TPR) repeat protein